MLCFPNAKINIGLYITSKRTDGFHNLETVFYPVPICDALEISDALETTLDIAGDTIQGAVVDNLVMKAYNLLKEEYNLPTQKINLLKKIPSGAGLGGGSADGTWMIKLLNHRFNLGLGSEKMEKFARKLGADCSFFVENKPVFGFGRGDEFKKCTVDLSGKHIVVIKPPIEIPTAVAFSNIIPKIPEFSLIDAINGPMDQWKTTIKNDFEVGIFSKFPEIAHSKHFLYEQGAIFAQMSGTGSAVFGIFNSKPVLATHPTHRVFYCQL